MIKKEEAQDTLDPHMDISTGLKEEPTDHQDINPPSDLLMIKKEEAQDTLDPPMDSSTGLKEEPIDHQDTTAVAVALLFFFHHLRNSNPASRRRFHRLITVLGLNETSRLASYARLNHHVPILRLWFNVELELKQDFSLTRQAMNSVQNLLHREQDHGWGQHLEVLIYIYWLAHGLSYRVVCRVFGVPKSTVHRVVHNIAQRIDDNLGRAISFPPPEELAAVGQGFGRLSGHAAFDQAVGAIDGCHIRIKPPSWNRLDYLNYKGIFTINMQAICDSAGRFLDIFVAYPGSVHDSRVLKNSSFYVASKYPATAGYFLLGDGAYPCLETPVCLITPYKEPVRGRVQENFNYRHSRARSIIERAFGMMKTRWRSTLFRALEVSPTFAPLVIGSCAFLHNVCLDNGDMLDPDDEPIDVAQDNLDPQPAGEPLAQNETPGNATRDRLATLISGHV